jgi:adenylate cyclase
MLEPMRRRMAPPRVHRGFAFVDLCGFTDFADEAGDDEAAEVLHVLRAGVREAATNHGVRVDKWLGDGAMLITVELPALLAAVVEAKWAISDQVSLSLRCGVAAGPVMIFEGDDYVGRAVNLAAKLCELAQPDQCLATADLAAACPVGLEATPIGARSVSGFHEPMELVAIDISTDEAGHHRRGLAAAVGRRSLDVAAAAGATPGVDPGRPEPAEPLEGRASGDVIGGTRTGSGFQP